MAEMQLSTLPIAEQAAYWLSMLGDDPTPECHMALMTWLQGSPLHVREFALALEINDRLRSFCRDRYIDIDDLIRRSEQEQRSHRQHRWTVRVAASLGAIALLSAGIFILQRAPATYTTTEYQQLIELDDGSVVALNRQSQLRVDLSAGSRDLFLESGQGIFRVRHDPRRPFRVHAGTAVVEAIGTQFDVRLTGGQATIAVMEGIVQLKPEAPSEGVDQAGSTLIELPRIEAGHAATVLRDGRAEEIMAINTAAVTAWRQPTERLQFQHRPLSEIATELNRHNAAPKLRIEGEKLRNRRFILVLKNADPSSLLNHLAQDNTLEFVHTGDDIIVRERTAKR